MLQWPGGLDAIPDVYRTIAGDVGERSWTSENRFTDPVFQAAPLLNVKMAYASLRILDGPGRTKIPESEDKLRRFREFFGTN